MKIDDDSRKNLEALASSGIMSDLSGAIGALHDHLERNGALSDPHTQYLVLRLRREEAAVSGQPNAQDMSQHWQEQIDAIATTPAAPHPRDEKVLSTASSATPQVRRHRP